jgi:DNA-binding NarL/FixJ family response regulator
VSDEPLRVLVVDDHPIYRDGIRALLSSDSDLCLAGEATTGAEAVRAAADLQPDVVLMDLSMPDLGGVESTRAIVQASPHIAVLILTMFDDDDSIFAAMRAGARGYLLKDAGQQEIKRAIKAAGSGEVVFGPGLAQRINRYFTAAHNLPALPAFPQLSEREIEVLDLVAAGLNNNEIARRLVLSPKTIRNYISNILAKLQVADRTQAVLRAREAGLGTRQIRPTR